MAVTLPNGTFTVPAHSDLAFMLSSSVRAAKARIGDDIVERITRHDLVIVSGHRKVTQYVPPFAASGAGRASGGRRDRMRVRACAGSW